MLNRQVRDLLYNIEMELERTEHHRITVQGVPLMTCLVPKAP